MLSMDAIDYEWARRKLRELVFRLQRMLARGERL